MISLIDILRYACNPELENNKVTVPKFYHVYIYYVVYLCEYSIHTNYCLN